MKLTQHQIRLIALIKRCGKLTITALLFALMVVFSGCSAQGEYTLMGMKLKVPAALSAEASEEKKDEDNDLSGVNSWYADMVIEDVTGRVHTVRGESIGGGKVRLTKIDGVKVHFTGEYHSLIVEHKDHPGVIAYVTTALSKCKVNIAYLRVYRETKGGVAYMIIESDEEITKETVEEIEKNPFVKDTMLIRR